MFSYEKIPEPLKNFIKFLIKPKIPKNISQSFIFLDQESMGIVEASLKQNYFNQKEAGFYNTSYLLSDEGKNDLYNHVIGRLNIFRNTVIPWLNNAKPLKGARILEIGCGTGSSTVALAEQGAEVTAIDILETSLTVAKDRCNVYELDVNFLCINATNIHEQLASQRFDFIIFFASLEHLTHNERMIAMKKTWELLTPGSLWCVIETPNRLWYYDHHTSLLPFFSWLPDDLAFLYSRFSPREEFSSLYGENLDNESKLDFLRRGRGVSFHEFELNMETVQELNVVSSLSIFLRDKNLLRKIFWTMTDDRRFEFFLLRIGPKIHRGFYQKSLDLIIKKD